MRDKTRDNIRMRIEASKRERQAVQEIYDKCRLDLNINPSQPEIETCLAMLKYGSDYKFKFDMLLLLLDRKRCPDPLIGEEYWRSTLNHYGYDTVEGSTLVEYLVKNNRVYESTARELLDKVIKEFPVQTFTGIKIRYLRSKVGKPLPYNEEIELLEHIVHERPPELIIPEDMIEDCSKRLIDLKKMAGTTDQKLKSVGRSMRNNKLTAGVLGTLLIATVLVLYKWPRSTTTIQNLNQNINGNNTKGAMSGIGSAYADSQVASSGSTVGHGNTPTTNGSSTGSGSSMWSTIASIGSKFFSWK